MRYIGRTCLVALMLMLFLGTSAAFAGEVGSDISIEIDGQPLKSDVNPVVIQERTMVPFRAVAEAINLQVDWIGETQTVVVKGDGLVLNMRIGAQQAVVNNIPREMEVAPVILSGRTLVPLRFATETFGCKVDWDEANRKVLISSPPVKMDVVGFYALGDKTSSSWTNLFTREYPETSRGNTDLVNKLALGWYSMDEKGNLLTSSESGWQQPSGWENVLMAAKKYSLNTQMTVHMTNRGGQMESMLRNEAAVKLAVMSIADEARFYDGVNLDFEGLGFNDGPQELKVVREDFARFAEALSRQLHRSGKELTLTLHAPNSAYQGYDYQALGKLADYIIIMAYDYGPRPEPEYLVCQAVEKALAQVPAEKLLLGISAPSENATSLANKVGIAKGYGLNGIALWRLGLIQDGMWSTLRDNIIGR